MENANIKIFGESFKRLRLSVFELDRKNKIDFFKNWFCVKIPIILSFFFKNDWKI